MINISDSAQTYFRHLLGTQGGDAIGIRVTAVHPGTPRADARLEFCENGDLLGDEWSLDCEGFTLFVDAPSVPFLDGAEIDYASQGTSSQLTIRAPRIKGEAPKGDASLIERVQWLLETEVNPQLESHKGKVSLEEITSDGVVRLRFGGGCHGCGMADVTLKQGIEKTLMARIPEITAVRDATDHSTGAAPYIAR
ncbi:MAG TPA: NfuA family Fe-S biogenesis protein [Arenimonas sp.]|uniref:NfuA family Fe-S biogenesis protein n=1 Tax=Arenimonas sp. TaxID=1872635 RepID=UPI002C5CF5D8|nr:NfuA family Fe-S biogenesis protein [Arenimonas sp.]HMB57742.1 NfuA family Fe-S biogenesis protein [Arenimonas sp.]